MQLVYQRQTTNFARNYPPRRPRSQSLHNLPSWQKDTFLQRVIQTRPSFLFRLRWSSTRVNIFDFTNFFILFLISNIFHLTRFFFKIYISSIKIHQSGKPGNVYDRESITMYRAEDSAEEDHMGDESDDDSEEMCTEEQRTPPMPWHHL